MRSIEFTLHGKRFIRISKTEARNRYNNDLDFYAAPCNVNVHSVWYADLFTQPLTETMLRLNAATHSFDSFVNQATALECNCETGRYLNFYKTI